MLRTRKKSLAASAALLAAGATLGLAGTAHAATTPLQVTLSADGGGTAAFNANGDPVLTLGPTGSYAQMAVKLKSTGRAEPTSPPSFTTDKYQAGSPRWVVELVDGYYLFGYPSQLGGGAKSDFTGTQWQVSGPSTTSCDGKYVSYATALSCADPGTASHVSHAFIVEDTGQLASTADTLRDVQYAGMTLGSGGIVSLTSPDNLAATESQAIAPVTVKATTNTTDQTLTYTATNLPTGLSIDKASGVISGTPTGTGGFSSTVTATNAYGEHDSAAFTYTVNQPTQTVVLSDGHVIPGTLLPNRAAVAWKATPAAPGGYRVVINGPYFHMRANVVPVTQAYYEGLASGHTYTVYVTPLAANGQPDGATGHVSFVTPR